MAKQHTARRGSGAAVTKNEPGNQTPDTPDINESEIARLKVDQLRDRLRRRGVTGTADMRKPELVDALIQALREGRKTTRSRGGSGSGSGSGRGRSAGSRSATGRQAAATESTELADLERRAAELADVAPQAPEVEEVERRAAELEAPGTEATEVPALPAAPARPDGDTGATAPALPAAPTPGAEADGGTVPRQRSGAQAGVGKAGAGKAGGPQPVRVAEESRAGSTLTIDRADRVVAAMVPPQVDEVVTPEGTRISGGAESVDTPPLPATGQLSGRD
ncbi:hypothetical protein [Micromonospora sp. AMSO31t]|uniref:hypothetical protein n=1 Tax=Micromonospora sp. AMSO31t TaxID=2650566 RepID=UPI00124B4E01|nr:hypothetical protein [Micromonospora sp. AMSO31t]KAB1913431.1 hypothetical protein F8274_10325 [Micromonospora sp. AMSO31t]